MSHQVTMILSATVILFSVKVIRMTTPLPELPFNDTECSIHDRLAFAKVVLENARNSLIAEFIQKVDLKTKCESCSTKPRDCSDLYKNGNHADGIYEIYPQHRGWFANESIRVYCDMTTDGGGWTVIQRRGDFGNSEYYFYQDWEPYRQGFGDLEKEFWLGNIKVFPITNQKPYMIRIDMEDWEGNSAYASYKEFYIDSRYQKYTLHVSGYSGTAGDSLSHHDGEDFSTNDLDNDDSLFSNCASLYKGGWWFKSCYDSFLNGPYRKGPHDQSVGGMVWHGFKGNGYSLKGVSMKIRPQDFIKSLSGN